MARRGALGVLLALRKDKKNKPFFVKYLIQLAIKNWQRHLLLIREMRNAASK
jgi:hypothetical protein